MNSSPIDRLDASINLLLAGEPPIATADSDLLELFAMARELHRIPAPGFQVRLRDDLVRQATHHSEGARQTAPGSAHFRSTDTGKEDTRPTRGAVPMFSTGSASFPLNPSRLALSFALHVAALALAGASGLFILKNDTVRTRVAQFVPASADFLFPVAPGRVGGGGGGGDHDKLNASNGAPPRFSSEQLTPPSIVVRNEDPKLPAEATVIGPPDLQLPKSDRLGDPLAAVLNPPSNGPGDLGGIGDGRGGGVGLGDGPGVGEGRGGGFGGAVFRIGGGVSAPHAIYDPDPEYSDEARKAKYQGNVVLEAVIGADGHPRSLRVVRSLGMGLDQKALDAVHNWRFSPALKDGRPVNVLVDIEVAFRLY